VEVEQKLSAMKLIYLKQNPQLHCGLKSSIQQRAAYLGHY